jgi:hypothetical protein
MGKEAYPKYLLALQTARIRAASVPTQGLLVVADANGDAGESFRKVREALEEATFPVPTKPFTVEEYNSFRVAVFLVPGEGQNGTLEDLLLQAVFQASPALEKCLIDLAKCTGGLKAATANKVAKMKMSVLAATFCWSNPWCSPSTIWSAQDNPVPITSDCFNPLSSLLVDFCR